MALPDSRLSAILDAFFAILPSPLQVLGRAVRSRQGSSLGRIVFALAARNGVVQDRTCRASECGVRHGFLVIVQLRLACLVLSRRKRECRVAPRPSLVCGAVPRQGLCGLNRGGSRSGGGGAPFSKNGPVTLRRLELTVLTFTPDAASRWCSALFCRRKPASPARSKRPTAVRAFKLAAHPAETQVLAAEKHSQHSCPESPNG